jgi:hypothetical protein
MDQTTEILPWCVVGVSFFLLWEVSFLFGLDGLDDDDGCAYAVKD